VIEALFAVIFTDIKAEGPVGRARLYPVLPARGLAGGHRAKPFLSPNGDYAGREASL